MKLEEIIVDTLQYYPIAFQTRTDVLHQLFIVLGCGFEWKDGELVDVCDMFREDGKITKDKAIKRSKVTGMSRLTPFIDPVTYPWTDACNLCIMPSNVKDDWKAGAEEIRAYLKTINYKFEERNT